MSQLHARSWPDDCVRTLKYVFGSLVPGHSQIFKSGNVSCDWVDIIYVSYSQSLLPGLPRQVFVLTDSFVSNTCMNACIQEARNNVKHVYYSLVGVQIDLCVFFGGVQVDPQNYTFIP